MTKKPELNPDIVKQIMSKIPTTAKGERVILSSLFFRDLTDEQFTVLFYMPGLEIIISEKCAEYIVKRATDLNLKKGRHTVIKKQVL